MRIRTASDPTFGPGRSARSAAVLLPLLTAALTLLMAGDRLLAGTPQPSALPLGEKVQVNQNFFADDQDAPAVAPLNDGGWYVVWRDRSASYDRVRSRRLNRAGALIGNESLVAAVPSFSGHPEVARLDDGRFIVVWTVSPPNLTTVVLGEQGVRGSFVTPDGSAYGAILELREGAPTLLELDVASSPGGGFVVTWCESATVWIRRFDAEGDPLESAVAASSPGGSVQTPRIARLRDGAGHVVVWTSYTSSGGDASHASVQWRRLAASGSWAGPQQQANSYTFGDQHQPDVAATVDGGFAILWRSDPNFPGFVATGEPLGDGIDLRYFDRDGVPYGPETTVSSHPADDVFKPALAAGADGDLVATWTFQSRWVTARRFLGRFAPTAELSVEDSVYTGSADATAIGVDAEGDLAIVWETVGGSLGGDDDDASVQARSFTVGRVGHWRLEESSGATAFDDAGIAFDDAALTAGDPLWSWGRPGRRALAFGGGGAATIPSSADLTITDSALTLTAWLYLETPPSALAEPFASVYDAVQDNYVLYLDRDAAELRFKVTTSNGTAERPGVPESELPLRQWFHVAGAYDGDGVAGIYLDGEVADQHSNPNLSGPVRSTPAQEAAIGRDGTARRYFFDGRVDELEVWRRALGVDELRLARGPWLFGDGFESATTLSWSSVAP